MSQLIFPARRFAALLQVLICLVVLSCASSSRPFGQSEETFELAYVSGGEVPTIAIVKVFPHGQLELAPLGQDTRTAELADEDRRTLADLIRTHDYVSIFLKEAEKGVNNVNPGEGFVGVTYREVILQRRFSSMAPEIQTLVKTVDTAARKAFGEESEHFLRPRIR